MKNQSVSLHPNFQLKSLRSLSSAGITSSVKLKTKNLEAEIPEIISIATLNPLAVRKLIAKNLKTLRKAKGMSQDELAQKAYMSQETVSRYERGRCGLTVENAVVFAQALGVSVADILKGTL
jgi:DNA-binding XRE family transcriptional regulator